MILEKGLNFQTFFNATAELLHHFNRLLLAQCL